MEFFCKVCLAQDKVNLRGERLDVPLPPPSAATAAAAAVARALKIADEAEASAMTAIVERQLAKQETAAKAAGAAREAAAADIAASGAVSEAEIREEAALASSARAAAKVGEAKESVSKLERAWRNGVGAYGAEREGVRNEEALRHSLDTEKRLSVLGVAATAAAGGVGGGGRANGTGLDTAEGGVVSGVGTGNSGGGRVRVTHLGKTAAATELCRRVARIQERRRRVVRSLLFIVEFLLLFFVPFWCRACVALCVVDLLFHFYGCAVSRKRAMSFRA